MFWLWSLLGLAAACQGTGFRRVGSRLPRNPTATPCCSYLWSWSSSKLWARHGRAQSSPTYIRIITDIQKHWLVCSSNPSINTYRNFWTFISHYPSRRFASARPRSLERAHAFRCRFVCIGFRRRAWRARQDPKALVYARACIIRKAVNVCLWACSSNARVGFCRKCPCWLWILCVIIRRRRGAVCGKQGGRSDETIFFVYRVYSNQCLWLCAMFCIPLVTFPQVHQ